MRRFVITLIVLLSVVVGFSFVTYASGILRITGYANLNTFDPQKRKTGEESVNNFMLYNGLTVMGQDLILRPCLAERWESSDDLKTWTFYIRKGVKFHHGRELDAEDVAATVNRILDKTVGATARVNFIVEKIEVVDKYTIRFKLSKPYAEFAELFTDGTALIVPRDRIDKLATEPIGTGPFKLKSFIPGDRVELVKNPDYFEKGVPILDGVTMYIIPESSTQITALETGNIDLVWLLPSEAIDRLKGKPNIVVDEVQTSSWDSIVMHNEKPPFNNLKVRQAIHLAIDKHEVVKTVLFGHGTPTHTPISPIHPYFNKNISFKTDLAKAKQLLAEAGYPNGFETELYVPGARVERVRLGVVTRELLKPLGIKVELQRMSWDKFVSDIEGKVPLLITGFYTRPTIDASLYPWYHSTGSWNLWHCNSPKTDKLLDLARQTKSREERKKIYMDFQKLVVEEPVSVVPYVANHTNAFRKEVKGFRSHPMMWLDLRRVTIAK
jgi:peptide/nickel transport system substrate-binding protein